MSSQFADNAMAGAALASLELHRTMITLMVLHKTVPKDIAIELIDQALARIEGYQMSGIPSLKGPAQAARLHIEMLLYGLRRLPVT
jgi:hypothetical protein